jgi:hypothetical protein
MILSPEVTELKQNLADAASALAKKIKEETGVTVYSFNVLPTHFNSYGVVMLYEVEMRFRL